MNKKIPRIMLTAISSNSGKTTVTMALLSALKQSKLQPMAFKAGPDYIDPMFHKEVLGIPSRNLDVFLLGEQMCNYLLIKNSREINILEGVMGYYDGIGNGTDSSSYSLAKTTKTPAVVVMEAKGMAATVAAVLKGIESFKTDSRVRGVIFNGLQEGMYSYYKNIVETHTNLKVYGYLPFMEDCSIGERHLGLITSEEILGMKEIVHRLGEQGKQTLDIDGLIELANSAEELEWDDIKIPYLGEVNLAIAKDKAFNFYYEDSLEVLQQMGANLLFFSPLKDETVPKNAHGMYLGGGYPELYGEKLSLNTKVKESIEENHKNKMPIFAECGGFMYLLETFEGKKEYPFVGVLQGKSSMTNKLQNFGYVTMTAKKDNLFCKAGEKINAHEFHYSKSDNAGSAFLMEKPMSKRSWEGIQATPNLVAGYPHIHFLGNISFAENFMKKMMEYKENVE